MSNHLEDLVAEWLEYNGYFVRKSVLVGRRANGGYDGELDVVGFHPNRNHLIHIECSLDALTWEKREARFTRKLEQGRKYVPELFYGLHSDAELDQIVLLQFGGGQKSEIGGGKLIWVCDLVSDIMDRLSLLSPDKSAVPSTYPLLRTMQLASQKKRQRKNHHQLIAV